MTTVTAPAAPVFVGVDVSKSRLDVRLSDEPAPLSVPNDHRGVGSLVRRLSRRPVRLLALEATGGYERRLVEGLLGAGVPVARVNPLRVRRFAQSRGAGAKNDRLDAAVLAEFARANADALRPLRPAGENARMLQELAARRRQLVEQCVANRNQLEHATLGVVRDSVSRTVGHLREEIALVEAEIQRLIDPTPPWPRGTRPCCRSPAWARGSAACWSASCPSWGYWTAARSPPSSASPPSTTTPAAAPAPATSAAGGPPCGRRCTWPRSSPCGTTP